jgi:hypothetical protein
MSNEDPRRTPRHDKPIPAPLGAGEDGLSRAQIVERIVAAMRKVATSKALLRVERQEDPSAAWQHYLDGWFTF